jgi:KipI family sensor histidine kinase inhibitor
MMSPLRLLTCGEQAVLIEVNGQAEVLALTEAVRAAVAAGRGGFAGVVDVVPAATTVLVTVDDGLSTAGLRTGLATLSSDVAVPADQPPTSEVIDIEVDYDGPDLDEVAELTGLSRDEVVAAHTGQTWQAGFIGFAPGFAYLSGGDPRLAVARRTEPRTSVPAGSVALAGEFSAIYPRSSPGGWQLIGRTDAVLFDVDRDPPALLPPGAVVRFVAVGSP